MFRNWRAWILLVLLVGPILAYLGFGFLWLAERGWATWAFLIWVTLGVAFGYLSARWTKARQAVLPPIDWDAPRTFTPFDRKAWALVEEEADKGDAIAMAELSEVDVYIATGRRLASRLAAHYHPLSTDPIEHLPVVEILTALELAAEDLGHLLHEVPGGDMITPAYWKRAVQAAGYFQKANEIYGYLLPIFQPFSGLVRLGTQKLMVQPAWRNMQQNVLRWFYRAFVNRLGTHLIELYSHRLAIGADHYRKLTRRRLSGKAADLPEGPGALVIAVAGARGAGKSALIAALDRARAGDLAAVRARLATGGFEEELAGLLTTAEWVEVPDYTVHDEENARDRATRREAIAEAVESDLLLLVIDGTRADLTPEARFATAWADWFDKQPGLEPPPALAVLTGADRPELLGDDGRAGRAAREAGLRDRVAAVRAALPPVIADVVPVGLGADPPLGIADRLLPALAPLLHRAERAALLRHLHKLTTRSKARRLASQIGRQGRRLWQGLKDARGQRDSHAS